jgi:bacillithiol biosynthesis cysteine-adding enzyme BshC
MIIRRLALASDERPGLDRLRAPGLMPPGSLDATPAALGRRPTSPGPPGPATRERWHEYLDRLDAPAGARRGLEAIAAGARVVVTGQQAGLLTGPHLTVLKAARAISLARELAEDGAGPVVPVFWIASDDHDLGEVNHTFVVNRTGEVERIRISLDSNRAAVCTLTAPEEAASVTRKLFEASGQGDREELIEAFAPRPGDSLSEWFARCLLELFGDAGLVPLEPGLVNAEAADLYARVLDDPAGWEEAFREGTRVLESHGLAAPLAPDPDPPLFLIEPHRRLRLRRAGNGFAADGVTFEREAALRAGFREYPRLSAGAALRPLVQNLVLPVVAYVAGPTEFLYWAQLGPLHGRYGIPYPALVLRPCATLLGHRACRLLEKAGLTLDEALERALGETGGETAAGEADPLIARGEQLLGELEDFLGRLEESVPGDRQALERRGRQLRDGLDQLLARGRKGLSREHTLRASRRRELEAWLRPRGKPQDRVLNLLPFLAEHGPELIDSLQELGSEEGSGWGIGPLRGNAARW